MALVKRLLERAVVAAVGLGLLAVIGYAGGWPLVLAVAALEIVALSEYYSALQTRGYRPNVHLGWLCAVMILLVTQQGEDVLALQRKLGAGAGVGGEGLQATAGVLQLILFVLLFCVMGTLVAQFKQRPGQSPVINSATTVFGVVYVGVLFSFLLRMRYVDVPTLMGYAEAGEFTRRMGGLLLVIAPVWLCDTAAFLVGSTMGKRKLCPTISPNKTVEGSVAGFVAAIVGALLVGAWLHVPPLHAALLGAMMGVLGQIGDLMKSVLKRDIGIKDFGSLFGPHGGVLDRFDAILVNMPLVYWYFWFYWLVK